MNAINLHLNIKNVLLLFGGGLAGLLALLLVADILVLNQIRATQQEQETYRTQLDAMASAKANLGAAITLIHDAALTGNIAGEAQARQYMESAKADLLKAATDEGKVAELRRIVTQMETHFETGRRMVRTYLLEGREAGNRAMAEPEIGYDALSDQLQEAMQRHTRQIEDLVAQATVSLAEAEVTARWALLTATTLLLLLVPIGFFLLYRKLMGSVNRMTATVQEISHGDFSARCWVTSGDELQTLADAFDNLLDDRVATLAKIEQENNAINDSIISILEATGNLSKRDLRINVPVSEDITGAIADSINGAVADMAEVLHRVRKISAEVRESSGSVDQQAQKVYQVAQRNLATVETTLKELRQASESMEKVVTLASMSHTIAGTAAQSTSQGLESVVSTTEGMNRIRTSIQETAKRIKRLGERSQEISGIIGIIKDITERTHVLALNARIQAATAGEAGKGFSVVADEVKQLAESSRQATAQIAQLIQNIQIETNDTIATMEQTVGEVVKGTELSERAHTQMLETQQTTNKLAGAVRQIASSSKIQMQLTQNLTVHAEELRVSALHTQKELASQRQQSQRLTASSEQLAQSVGQFVLPETA